MSGFIKLEDAISICSAYCPDDDGTCSKAGNDLRDMLDEIESLPTIELDVHHKKLGIKRYLGFIHDINMKLNEIYCRKGKYNNSDISFIAERLNRTKKELSQYLKIYEELDESE